MKAQLPFLTPSPSFLLRAEILLYDAPALDGGVVRLAVGRDGAAAGGRRCRTRPAGIAVQRHGGRVVGVALAIGVGDGVGVGVAFYLEGVALHPEVFCYGSFHAATLSGEITGVTARVALRASLSALAALPALSVLTVLPLLTVTVLTLLSILTALALLAVLPLLVLLSLLSLLPALSVGIILSGLALLARLVGEAVAQVLLGDDLVGGILDGLA